ncbi:peptide-methionine (S)-S-oxide reductase MsrA [Vreelandella subglaciescola]|jgi:peptide-methionine (S)-S-oxide reductase|uniref:Peptide methionine sulfoxide reductase MsrA n=1 Tax=Vreelandella subglaciescola TaxID=29571 RepID=A0A1M7FWF0_9GAMM|nr:peptide-methionine (S)-S-oxide reductase MsrA [Halomonas subglaciescola]SHM08128.1 peptide-methionine (S)-S-oxide reductase [Halomonas subglaciescola]
MMLSTRFRLLPLAAAIAAGMVASTAHAAETTTAADGASTAVFAGGCFWCMEPPYDDQAGVTATTSGYIGGELKNPSYEEISGGGTGHAEAVKVTYNADEIGYAKLLEIFWRNIDPFAEDRQFCDSGAEYRSAIFYSSERQRELAEASKAEMQERFDQEIATQIVPASTFWDAEDYHQNYAEKNPLRYKFYRFGCGRDDRLEEVWGDEAGGPTFN